MKNLFLALIAILAVGCADSGGSGGGGSNGKTGGGAVDQNVVGKWKSGCERNDEHKAWGITYVTINANSTFESVETLYSNSKCTGSVLSNVEESKGSFKIVAANKVVMEMSQDMGGGSMIQFKVESDYRLEGDTLITKTTRVTYTFNGQTHTQDQPDAEEVRLTRVK